MREREQAAFDRLTRLGGESLLSDLAVLYRDQMAERLRAAHTAVRERDAERLGELAHAMRSSSAQLGADDIVAACDAVETAAEHRDEAGAAASLSALEERFHAFSQRLAERTGERPSAGRVVPDDVAGGHGIVRPVIAVIEDNADNRLLLDAMLGDRFELDEYESGPVALAGMVVRRPDLVLLDVSLPGMDGLGVLARMRKDATLRGVPVVAVTAHAMAGDRERYLAAGFGGYVPKPIVDEDVLIATINALLPPHRRAP